MKINHTRILNAYLARLTTKDLEKIMQANNDWQHSALNHGNTTQLKAQENFMAAISHAISNVIQHDIINIEKIILEEVAE
jgi:hypothetical protein